MLRNNVFDLIHAIEKKSEAISVYDTYIKDCQHDNECMTIWKTLKTRDEESLKMLTSELDKHVRQGELTSWGSKTGTHTTGTHTAGTHTTGSTHTTTHTMR